jgi:Polysaccharide lyase family 4, domain II
MYPLIAVIFAVTSLSAYTEKDVGRAGTISGKISYNGKPPSLPKLSITMDRKYCGESRDDDSWLITADGGVKNVVVYLSDITSGKKMTAPQRLIINQVRCSYVPRLSVVAKDAELQVRSSDPVLHNIHTYREGSTLMNFAIPPLQGFAITKKLDKPGGIKLKCDVHNFMRGAIFVASNPYYAVTSNDGSFEISDVPPGTYTINTWHEAAGPIAKRVTVSDGGAVTWNAKIR